MTGTDENKTQPETERLTRAIAGCLWGTAIGDALGLPMEGLTRQRQARMVPDLSRYHLLFGRGMVSDDTEHAWMVARALLVSGGEEEAFGRSLARQMRVWLLALPAGVGFATLRAVLRLWVGVSYRRSGVYSAGNGPAMRSALLGVCWGHDLERLRALTRVSTRITHTDPKAYAGALAVALAAHLAASAGANPNAKSEVAGGAKAENDGAYHLTILWGARLTVALEAEAQSAPEAEETEALDTMARLAARARDSVLAGQTTAEFADALGLERGVTGYILHTVPVALHAWLRHPGDVAQAAQAVIRCGGDTDTTAAIAGALAGTAAGAAVLPERLRRDIWTWPFTESWVETLSRRLARSLAIGQPQPVPRVNPLAVLARNLVFLIVILAHGFRRLLPPY